MGTHHSAVTFDYFPTVLDLLGELQSAEQRYDGISLLPLLTGRQSPHRHRKKAIGFKLHEQSALILETNDEVWKVLRRPVSGQCEWQHGLSTQQMKYTLLFNLKED